jgi:hypothetical protein
LETTRTPTACVLFNVLSADEIGAAQRAVTSVELYANGAPYRAAWRSAWGAVDYGSAAQRAATTTGLPDTSAHRARGTPLFNIHNLRRQRQAHAEGRLHDVNSACLLPTTDVRHWANHKSASSHRMRTHQACRVWRRFLKTRPRDGTNAAMELHWKADGDSTPEVRIADRCGRRAAHLSRGAGRRLPVGLDPRLPTRELHVRRAAGADNSLTAGARLTNDRGDDHCKAVRHRQSTTTCSRRVQRRNKTEHPAPADPTTCTGWFLQYIDNTWPMTDVAVARHERTTQRPHRSI